LMAAEKYPVIVSECGANTKKFGFMPAESQEGAETWVPRFLGFVQQHKLHWTAFSLHPGSAPVLIKDWKYTPSPEWGTLVKKALARKQFPVPDKLREEVAVRCNSMGSRRSGYAVVRSKNAYPDLQNCNQADRNNKIDEVQSFQNVSNHVRWGVHM